jgi:hypothetical protein
MTKLKDLATLIATLGLPIGGSWAAVVRLWTDTTLVSQVHMRILLVVAAALATALVLLAWWALKQHKLLATLKKPLRFQDECTFDPRIGVYRHSTKPGLFCGTCIPAGIESPLTDAKHGWRCMVDRSHWHPDPDRPEPPDRYPPSTFVSGF